jgi:hypothetical protein
LITVSAMRSAESCGFFAASAPAAFANFVKSARTCSETSWNCGVGTASVPPVARASALMASRPAVRSALLEGLWTSESAMKL